MKPEIEFIAKKEIHDMKINFGFKISGYDPLFIDDDHSAMIEQIHAEALMALGLL